MAEIITLSSDDEDASAKGMPLKRKLQDDPPLGIKQAKISNDVDEKTVTNEMKIEVKSPVVVAKSVFQSNNVSAQNSPCKKDGLDEATNDISPSCSTSSLSKTSSPVASTSSADTASVPRSNRDPIYKKRVELMTLTPTKNNVRFGANLDKTPPLLVVKKIEPVKEDSEQTAFSKFLEACQRKDSDESMQRILNKVQKKFDKLDAEDQAGLSDLLVQKVNEINRRDPKVYLHIEAVNNAIKMLLRKERKKEEEVEVKETKEPEVEEPRKTAEENAQDRERRIKIRKIEKAMAKCEKIIKEFGEAEVDFEEDENSAYMKYERYKKRQVELFNELCKYTKDASDAGRQYLKPKTISVTCLPQVNEAISSFVNSAVTKRNNLLEKGRLPDVVLFPDHIDILKCIKHCNKEKNLGLDDRFIQNIAEKAFKDVGTFLQRLRREDYWDTFSIYLESANEDPAVNDKELAEQLKVNKEIGDKRLNDVFDEFAKKQEGIDETVEDVATDAESENEEDEEEENEDDVNDDDDPLDVTEDKTDKRVKQLENELTTVDKDVFKKDEDRGPELCGSLVHETVESAKVSSNLVSETPIVLESRSSPTITKSKDDQSEPQQNVDTMPKDSESQSAAVSVDMSEDNSVDKAKDEGRTLIRVRSFAKPPSSWTEKTPEKSTVPARVPSPRPPRADSPEIIECKIPENKKPPLVRKHAIPTVISRDQNGKVISSNVVNKSAVPIIRPANSGNSSKSGPSSSGELKKVTTNHANKGIAIRAVFNPGTSNAVVFKGNCRNGEKIKLKTFAVPEKKLIRHDQGPSNVTAQVKSTGQTILRVPTIASLRGIPPVVTRVTPNVQRHTRLQPASSLPLSTLPSNVQIVGTKQKVTQQQTKNNQ